MLEGTRPAVQVRLADQVRVAVIYDGAQHDMALPAARPVAQVIESMLRVLANGQVREPGEDGQVRPGAVHLSRVNDPAPLDREQTLTQQDVRDGDLLVLQVGDAPVALTPVVENASSAIAKLLAARPRVTDDTALRFAAAAMAAAVMMAVGLAVYGWRIGLNSGWDVWPAAGTAGLAAVLLVAGSLTWWRQRNPVAADACWLCAAGAAPVAAFMAPPGPPGAYSVAFAAVTAAALCGGLLKLTPAPRGPLSWAAITACGAATTAAAHALGVSTTHVWVAALAVTLLVLKRAERLAGRMARIPVPPFPTVTGKFVWSDADDIAAEALAAAEHDGTPSMAELGAKARAANTYLTALVAACAMFFLAGAWGAVTMPGQGRWWLSDVYVAVLAGALVLGGRAFADRAQACIVVATALGMVTLAAVKHAVWFHTPAACLAAAALVLSLAAAGWALAVAVPAKVFSALLRKLVEWCEYALIVAVIPVCFWLLNIYYLARNH